MRLPVLLVAATLAATPLRGQTGGDVLTPRVRRAFEPTITTWAGARNFGTRSTILANGNRVSLSPSLAIGGTATLPMTRRTGFLVDLHVAPLSRQAVKQESGGGGLGNGQASYDRVIAIGASAAVAARLRAQAPIFAFVGASGLMMPTRPFPGTSGGVFEPGGIFGLGFDSPQRDRLGFRAIFTGYLMKPGDPGSDLVEAKSIAFDWSIGLGLRWNLHHAAVAEAR